MLTSLAVGFWQLKRVGNGEGGTVRRAHFRKQRCVVGCLWAITHWEDGVKREVVVAVLVHRAYIASLAASPSPTRQILISHAVSIRKKEDVPTSLGRGMGHPSGGRVESGGW